MDEDDFRILARERFKSGMHRALPRRSAFRGRLVAQLTDRLVEHRRVVRIDDRLHSEDPRMQAKRFHGAEDHGLPANRTVLFRSPRAGTEAAPGGDKDGCSPFSF